MESRLVELRDQATLRLEVFDVRLDGVQPLDGTFNFGLREILGVRTRSAHQLADVFVGSRGFVGATGPAGQPGTQGPAGQTGPTGNAGQNGRDGRDGQNGADGKDGKDGTDGNLIRSAQGPPGPNVGVNGDLFLDRSTSELYGPKTDSGWGAPVQLRPKGGRSPDEPRAVQVYIPLIEEFVGTPALVRLYSVCAPFMLETDGS